MKTQHTPGPWKYPEPEYDTFAGLAHSQQNDPKRIRIELVAIYAPGGDEVARIVHDPDDGFDLINDREEHEANARLIAAAPELLEFVEMIANGGINEAGEATIESEARALIAKATK